VEKRTGSGVRRTGQTKAKRTFADAGESEVVSRSISYKGGGKGTETANLELEGKEEGTLQGGVYAACGG